MSVPCSCGATAADWRDAAPVGGDTVSDTARVYACDNCWRTHPNNPAATRGLGDTITNRKGKLSSVTGEGVAALQWHALYLALRFRQQTGADMDSRFNSVTQARKRLGLKTRDIGELMAACVERKDAAISRCRVTNE